MYIVVRNDAVLSRTSKDALLSWLDAGVSHATDFRYAITFDTFSGAHKCAGMQGGTALPLDIVVGSYPAGGRVGPGGGDGVVAVGG